MSRVCDICQTECEISELHGYTLPNMAGVAYHYKVCWECHDALVVDALMRKYSHQLDSLYGG